MKQLKILFLLVLILSIVGCADETSLKEVKMSEAELSTKAHRRSAKEAVEYANRLVGGLSSSTRSAKSVSSIENIKLSKTGNASVCTRSDSEDDSAIFYLINYEEDEGFALISADKSLPPVLALSDESNLSLSDTIENPALSTFFNRVLPDIYADSQSSDEASPNMDLVPDVVYELIPKRLTKAVGKWHRNYPYNFKASKYKSSGEKDVLKHDVISIAQIMSYYGYPKKYSDLTHGGGLYKSFKLSDIGIIDKEINWELIRNLSLSSNASASSLENVEDFLNLLLLIDYASPGTREKNKQTYYFEYEGIPAYFENMGYYTPIKLSSCGSHFHAVATELDWKTSKSLLYENYLLNVSDCEGNVSVIDGCSQILYAEDKSPQDEYMKYLFHCVWGTGGKDNGWFMICTYNNIYGSNHGSMDYVYYTEPENHGCIVGYYYKTLN